MQTQVLPPTPDHLQQAADLIRAGEIVAFPTETVYGLGANAYDESAVQKIFIAKGRPTTDPLIVHIHALHQLAELAVNLPPVAYPLAERFWAGALTLILEKSARLAPNVTGGLTTVGIRMPSHPVALALLRAADVPICAPSANLFTRPSPTTAAHVLADLNGRIPMILDGGSTDIGLESTILNLLSDPPTVLRAGGIPLEALQSLIPNVRYQPRYLTAEEANPAPGQMLKHYAPRAALTVVLGQGSRILAYILAKEQEAQKNAQKLVIVALEQDLQALAVVESPCVSLGQDLAQAAHNLFGVLRDLDEQGVDQIIVRGVAEDGLGAALADRLYRAAEGRVEILD